MDSLATFGDPKFVNLSANNFQLRDSSIYTINKGDPNYSSSLSGTVDFLGSNRVYNNIRIDMGAYEFQGNPIIVTAVSSPTLPSSAINILTNPIREKIYYQSTVAITDITITDVEGRKLKHIKQPNGNIDIQEFQAGVYYIQFFTKKYAPLVKRIVKL
jgi:Secretion system C-terminal sorting domain